MEIIHGNNLEVMRGMADNSVDSIVTDPPYGLSFMGKKWDYDVPSVELWTECLRVLKPGGHLLAFAGTRTQHRMAVRIEDAGFEIRDMIAWVYGSGFPKSLNVGKAVDEKLGNERKVVGEKKLWGHNAGSGAASFSKNQFEGQTGVTRAEPITQGESEWEGWGTALKPAMEMITVARKPLTGTVAENVMEWGTGAINVDGCRVGTDDNFGRVGTREKKRGFVGIKSGERIDAQPPSPLGRWPANLIHDGSEEVVGLFPQSNGGAFPKKSNIPTGKHYDGGWGAVDNKERIEMGEGSAARFFYCAKASKRDRDEGCDGMELKEAGIKNDSGRGFSETDPMKKIMRSNHHPTVKPTDLMRYLVRLVTPKGGTVLDPFMGSGSTGKACVLEGMDFIGIDRELEYVEIAKARIAFVQQDVEVENPNTGQLSLFD